MISKLNFLLIKFIANLLKIDYKRASVVKYGLLIVILIFFLILLVYFGLNILKNLNNFQELNKNDNITNIRDNQEVISTPTEFIIPTPTYTRDQATLQNFRNEIPLNDNRFFYSITIKRNTELKLINLTQRPIILEMNNGLLIRVDINSIQTVFFSETGDFTMNDVEYQNNGFVIKVKVIE